MCPSHLSKYPARSHWGACARSLNSLKVPFICSKSRIAFVQGLLFLDKSLALVQALDCVRMFHRPQQDGIAKRAFPAGPLSCDTDSKSQPRASALSSPAQQRPRPILILTPVFLEEASHTQHKLVTGWSSLRHSIFGLFPYHRLSFPVEQAGETLFPCLSVCLVSDSNL